MPSNLFLYVFLKLILNEDYAEEEGIIILKFGAPSLFNSD